MEEYLQHFSHVHPLSFFKVNDDEDVKPHRCTICGLPILSSPSYTCIIDANCNFFLHKPCAHLPREFFHDRHVDILYLQQPNSPSDHANEWCIYKCKNYSNCKFDLHPLIAKPVEIKSKHVSHKAHALVAFCREIVSPCDGCEEVQKGFFFYCAECNFWIHQDCTILPSIVKIPSHHPHPYILTYSLPFDVVNGEGCHCSFCHQLWRFRYSGVYFCGDCYSFAHVTCAKSSTDFLKSESTMELIQLPDEEDIFPNLIIRKFIERNPFTQTDGSGYHQHPLFLEHGIHMSSTSREASDHNLVCDVCIQPINTSPFYICQHLQSCHFLAHDMCRNHLPTTATANIVTAMSPGKIILSNSDEMSKIFFASVFLCCNCRRPSNGFCYMAVDKDGNLMTILDLECAVAPKTIKHASHRQHVLFQTFRNKKLWAVMVPLSCCAGESLNLDVYKCVVCDFYIHVRCALLPKTTRHKFDEHPLKLIMDTYHSEDDRKEYHCFCELCEEDIDQRFWYYGCGKCQQYFHINCLPSVGYLSRVKFGKTLADSMNIYHPQHPLTLTRMLTMRRHAKCGVCKGIIKGFTDDEMAFRCSRCDFWVHFSCACASIELIYYSKFLEDFEQTSRAMWSKLLEENVQ